MNSYRLCSQFPAKMRLLVSPAVMLCSALLMIVCMTPAEAAEDARQQGPNQPYVSPRWVFEFKGGLYYPDLDDYETYYGSDHSTIWALAGAYKITNWLEVGAELGYTNDDGVGSLPNNSILGGEVDYTLMPLQIFLNLQYEASADQLFVPYAGIGIATAWYKQEIDQQSDVTGRSDIGGAARVGLRLQITNSDRHGANYLSGDRRLQTYLFLEGQIFSTEVDGIDLGGEAYFLGLRLEFD